MTKYILHSGIEVVGEYQHKLSDETSVSVLTNYPSMQREYKDKRYITTNEVLPNGLQRIEFRSDDFVVVKKRDRVTARIPRSCIKEQFTV
jgi:hypothetical protein